MKQKNTYIIVAFMLLLLVLPLGMSAQIPVVIEKPKQAAPEKQQKVEKPQPVEKKKAKVKSQANENPLVVGEKKQPVGEKKQPKEKKQKKEKAQKTQPRNDMRRGEWSYSLFAPGYVATPFEGSVEWQREWGISCGFGVGYTHWFSRHVGFSSGLRFSYVHHNETVSNVNSVAYGTMPIDQRINGVLVTTYASSKVDVSMNSIHEDRIFALIEVPLYLTLQARHFYCNLGVSFDYVANTNESYTYDGNIYALTDVNGLGVSLTDPIPITLDGEMSYNETPVKAWNKLFCMVGAELGWKIYFDYRNMMSIGLYGRYALNKASVDDLNAQPLSIAKGSIVSTSPLSTGLVDSYGYYEAGLRIAYHFGTGKSF